jgi:DNA-directed RNA polymerase beta subunit
MKNETLQNVDDIRYNMELNTKVDVMKTHVEIRSILAAIEDAMRYLSIEIENSPDTMDERLHFLKERLEGHQLLHHQFRFHFARSLEKVTAQMQL